MFFGPYPLTYKTLAPRETLNYLATVMNNVQQLKPFHMIKDKEFEPEDKVFLLKVMKLDPRDRPTAQQLLADPWFSQEIGPSSPEDSGKGRESVD
jgi:serine/threonine protein kinase